MSHRSFPNLAALAASLLAAALGSAAQMPSPAPANIPQPKVGSAIRFDLSPPLREMKRIPPPWEPRREEERERPNEILPKALAAKAEKGASRDTAVQAWPGSQAAMPGPVQNWEGIGNLNGVQPPDTNGDVGPNHYMQWVNLSLAIWDKQGNLVYGPVDGNTIWQGFGGACDSSNDGDPVVLYDRMAQRWVISQFACVFSTQNGPYYQYVAVSQTSDPTGAWYRYEFEIPNSKFGDYPKMGAWPDAYYMTVNQFAGNSWGGAGVFALERAKMLTGDPTARFIYFDLASVNMNYGGMLPAHVSGPVFPPAGAPGIFVEMDDDAWGYSPDQLALWEFHSDWNNLANSTFGLAGNPTVTLPTESFDSNLCNYNGCVPQPGATAKLDSLSDRLMYRLQYFNFGDHQSLVTCHTVDTDGTNHAGIRWYELRNTGSAWSIYQQGTYGPDSDNRWMGSLGMDKAGNMALGYSVSSSVVYPSIRYAGRMACDPLGELPQAEQSLIAGGGSQTSIYERWGDYSSISLDPSDDCTFWYTTEYYATTSSSGWQTRVASFKFPNCGQPVVLVTAQASPTSGYAPLQVTFAVDCASNGIGPYTYAWDFGDGSTDSGVSVAHAYTKEGHYSAKVTVTDSAALTGSASFEVTVTVPPPVISAVRALTGPFRLKVTGSNFHSGCTMTINGTPVPVIFKSVTTLVAKGSAVKALVPKGVPVSLVVTNTDDGGVSAAYVYTR